MKNVESILSVLASYGIDEVDFLDASLLTIINDRLLKDFSCRTCILFTIPYNTKENNPTLISKYASPRDYHYFCNELFEKVLPELEDIFPNHQFLGFADHSPFNEREAASMSRLGFIGDNGLFISRKYGSYIFLGEIATTLDFSLFADYSDQSNFANECAHCGRCSVECPTGVIESGDYSQCLSFISQKKVKTKEEFDLIYKYGTAWGCDICQICCVHNEKAQHSKIPFFSKELLNEVDSETIVEMPDEEFRKRAFAWRGKKVIVDNLNFFESHNKNVKNKDIDS